MRNSDEYTCLPIFAFISYSISKYKWGLYSLITFIQSGQIKEQSSYIINDNVFSLQTLVMSKKRNYDDSYIQFGFDFIFWMVLKNLNAFFAQVLGNGSLKPSILRQHLQSSHPIESNYSNEEFSDKSARVRAEGTLAKQEFLPEHKVALEASYTVDFKIAKAKKDHTIGETFFKPCGLEMVRLMIGEEARRKIQQIPLSNDTIRKPIGDISLDIREQVVAEIRSSPSIISPQLDESTDV